MYLKSCLHLLYIIFNIIKLGKHYIKEVKKKLSRQNFLKNHKN